MTETGFDELENLASDRRLYVPSREILFTQAGFPGSATGLTCRLVLLDFPDP